MILKKSNSIYQSIFIKNMIELKFKNFPTEKVIKDIAEAIKDTPDHILGVIKGLTRVMDQYNKRGRKKNGDRG